MNSAEQRVRRWLRVYPRAYRERRGDEVAATLLDKARDDPRLRAREVASVLTHAGSMRIRRYRLEATGIALAALGAGVGAIMGLASGPIGYEWASTSLPGQINASAPTAAITQQLQQQARGFEASLTTSAARRILHARLSAPYPSCTTTVVDSVGNRGLHLTCSAATSMAAQTAGANLSQALGAFLIKEQRMLFHHAELRTLAVVARMRGVVGHARYVEVLDQIEHVPVATAAGQAVARLVGELTNKLDREEALAQRLREGWRGAIMTTSSGPTSAVDGIPALPVEAGAAIGLLAGLVLGASSRRRIGGPIPI